MSKFRKLLLSLTSFSLFSLITIHYSLLSAQTPLQKAQEDYSFQFTRNRDLHDKYLVSKSSYESFKTAASKNEAYLSSKNYLKQVDEVYIAYLLLVKEYGNNVDWQDNNPTREKIVSKIDLEMNFIRDHEQKIEAAKTLEELPTLAANLKEHILQVTLPTVYWIGTNYELTESKNASKNFDTLVQKINEKIVAKYSPQDSIFLNWQSEIAQVKTSSQTQIDRANEIFSRVKSEQISEGDFKQISQTANQAKDEIKKSQLLLGEILRLI